MWYWPKSGASVVSLKCKGKKRVGSEEIRQEEEKTRMTVAVGQAQQGSWTRWEMMQERRTSWEDL